MNRQGLRLIALAVITFLAILATVSAARSTEDQAETLQTLFTQLMQDETYPPKRVEIRFVHPIADGEPRDIGYNNTILPQYQDFSITVLNHISEVGVDFVCFTSTGGSVRYRECIPFSNIASVNFEP
ncbi:MAG: hypothetical protein MUF87_16775 [Anaerolineae bacterium]|jgi:hypothetical protein|nr:hypothetical protein [Anaerolineae bacterium]